MKEKDFGQNKEVYRVFRNYFITVLFFTLLIVGYIFQSVNISSMRHRILNLSTGREMQLKKNSSLRFKLQSLSSPSRIEVQAVSKYGFQRINSDDIKTIELKENIRKSEEENRDLFVYLWDVVFNSKASASPE